MERLIVILALLFQVAGAEGASPFFEVADNATYGCRRPHGFGVYDDAVNKTFVCWNGPGMSVLVREYDHASKSWSEQKTIQTLSYYGKWDYHNYPNMAQAPDGRLMVIWADHCDNLQIAQAVQSHNLTGEWKSRIIAENHNAYPMVVTYDDAVYVFYSVDEERAWPYRSFGYIKSVDNGETWSEHNRGIDSEKMDPGHYDEVYAYHFQVEPGTGVRPDRIHFSWLMRGGPNGHNAGEHNAYFAYFIPSTASWAGADGADLGDWISYQEMLDHCLVWDTGAVPAGYPIDKIVSSYFADGTPVVFYTLNGATKQAVWADAGWQQSVISDLSVKSVRRLSDGALRLLLASASQTEMEILQQDEKGASWRSAFLADIPYKNGADRTWAMGFIDNGLPEAEVLLSQIEKGQEKTDYSGSWPVWSLDTSVGE